MLGVSRQGIHDLVKRGIIEEDADGQINIARAKTAIAQKLAPGSKTSAHIAEATGQPASQAPEGPQPEDATNYHVAKTMREIAEARIAKLKADELEGQLVRLEAVKREWSGIAARIRETLLQMPDRLAPVLEMRPLGFVRQTLDTEIRAALQGLSE